MKLDIHLIGPFPPPYGGVSIHMSRLRSRLLDNGHRCTVWSRHHDPDNLFFLLNGGRVGRHCLLDRISDQSILHFHSHHRLAGQLAAAGYKVLFTVHNERINSLFMNGKTLRERISNHFSKRAFKNVTSLIAVSSKAEKELIRFGFNQDNIKTITAYLKPDQNEVPPLRSLELFQEFRNKHTYLLAACAKASNLYQGEDIYGVDLCVELIHRLTNKFRNIGLVLAIPGGQGTNYCCAHQRRAEELGVSDNILWLHELGVFHPLLKQSDLFLRPTNTDGFSLSVAEAIEYGVPTVASDAVPRPEACVLFNSRDLNDFLEAVTNALDNINEFKGGALNYQIEDQYDSIASVYRSLYLTTHTFMKR